MALSKSWLGVLLGLFLLVGAAPRGTMICRAAESPAVAVLDPNRAVYPRSSLHDFSGMNETPAGKRGFIRSENGHFYFEDGTRARFWGINVANTSLQESEADIDAMIANFRAAGFNLIRLHHFDERGGVIDLEAEDSRQLLPERLRKLDYWIYKAREAGLYIYLDLLAYRRFKEGDGVPNAEAIGRAARPYAVFDERLIELQKEYARKLLREHVNSYTGLAYADDPTVVMLEIYDESGLFMRRGVWREMPEPYATNFRKLWNEWLLERYKTTDALLRAWTDDSGVSALTPGESLEKGNIELPAMTWTPQQLSEAQRVYSKLPRRNDGAIFAYQIHRKYFREMKKYLQEIGVKVPVSVTGRFEDIADLKSIADELDFIGTNFYYDHPYWGTGKPAWQPPSYFHGRDPLTDIGETSLAPQLSLSRIQGKPLVVREWNYCWPNTNRGVGIIEAAAYAALHDIDAMILFVYETRPTPRVAYFNVRNDPARWGMCGIGAMIYRENLVSPARQRVLVPYNAVDTFTYTRYHQLFYALGWATRMENAFYDRVYRAGNSSADLLLMPGRSGYGKLEGAPAVLHTSRLTRDLAGRAIPAPEYLEEYGFAARRAVNLRLDYNGILYPQNQQKQRELGFSLGLKQIQASGKTPIGTNAQWGVANGFVDESKRRLVFSSLEEEEVLLAGFEALRRFRGGRNTRQMVEKRVFESDTGELLRDASQGRLTISTPQAQVLAGDFGGGRAATKHGLTAENLKGGVLTALSLDGKPLVESEHFMIKMVTDAKNADDVTMRDPRFIKQPNGQWMITVLGQGPVVTGGKSAQNPISVSLGNRRVLDVYLSGGGFELYVEGENQQFYCDTPEVRFALYDDKLGHNNFQQVLIDGSTLPLAGTRQSNKLFGQFPQDAVSVRLGGKSG